MEKPDFPTGERFSAHELGNLFFAVEATPFENQSFAYRILIAKGWQSDPVAKVTGELDSRALAPLAAFRSPAIKRSNAYVLIQAVKLDREITAADWIRHYCIITKRRLLALNVLSFKFCDSLMQLSIEEETFTARGVALVDGDRLFFILAFAHESAYKELADILGQSVASFRLLHGSPEKPVEGRLQYTLGDDLAFNCPISWKAQPVDNPPEGRKGIDLYHFDEQGDLDGVIRAKSVRKAFSSGVTDEIQRLKEEYMESGVVLGRPIYEGGPERVSSRFSNGGIYVFEARIRENENLQELWISCFEDSERFLIYSLLTIYREHSFFLWAMNRRAYEIILESL